MKLNNRTATKNFIKCPVCGGYMPVTKNSKGRYQAFCYSCHTSIFFNTPASVELAELKGVIFPMSKLELEASHG
jgi:transcription elongation factor Elf1